MKLANFQELSEVGLQIGLGIAVTPIVITSVVACSKILLINIIANIAISILTAGAYRISIEVSFVQVPLLWKTSFILAGIGVSIAAISFIGLLIQNFYQYYQYHNTTHLTDF